MTTPTQMQEYFEAGKAIVARLKDQVPALQEVNTPFGTQKIGQNSANDLVAHVVYSGDVVPTPTGSNIAGSGSSAMTAQRWLVVLAVRVADAAGDDGAQDILNTGGATAKAILDALMGWSPAVWMRPLTRVNGMTPGYSSSFMYFPFMFEGKFVC